MYQRPVSEQVNIHKRLPFVWLLGAMVLHTACGGQTAIKSDVDLVAAYDPREFIVGVGRIALAPGEVQGSQTLIRTRDAADDAISRIISSKISSVLTAVESSINSEFNASVVYGVKSESTLEPGVFELIKTSSDGIQCDRSSCVIIRYIARRDLFKKHQAEYRPLSETFRASVSQSRDAQSRAAQFAHHYRVAEDTFKSLITLGSKMEAAYPNGDTSAILQDRELYIEAVKMRDKVLAQIRISVAPFQAFDARLDGQAIQEFQWQQGPVQDPTMARKARGALTTAISQLGISSNTSNGCEGTHVLEPSAELVCADDGGLGCALRLSGQLRRCSDKRMVTEFEFGSGAFTGISTDYSVPEARSEVLRRLNGEAIVPLLRSVLSRHLPLR